MAKKANPKAPKQPTKREMQKAYDEHPSTQATRLFHAMKDHLV